MARRKRIRSLEDILAAAKSFRRKQVLACAAAEDDAVLKGVGAAVSEGIVEPVLIGDTRKIRGLARSLRVSLAGMRLVHEPDPMAASLAAVKLCREGAAQALMKGMVQTSVILKAVLDRERGLSTGRILSHAAVFAPKGLGRLMILTDAGVNIAPDVARKIEILRNTVALAEGLGMAKPRVAVLAAVEQIKPEMTATTDAAIITQMAQNGQLDSAVVGGPYALDIAVSPHAAKCKHVPGVVPGRADILLAPDIEAGNILYKALVHFAEMEMATLVLGATVPVVVSSRSDSGPTKLYSIALAMVLANALRNKGRA